MEKLLYGCGLRIKECVRLRVKDVEFKLNQVIVHNGKGMKGERDHLGPSGAGENRHSSRIT